MRVENTFNVCDSVLALSYFHANVSYFVSNNDNKFDIYDANIKL